MCLWSRLVVLQCHTVIFAISYCIVQPYSVWEGTSWGLIPASRDPWGPSLKLPTTCGIYLLCPTPQQESCSWGVKHLALLAETRTHWRLYHAKEHPQAEREILEAISMYGLYLQMSKEMGAGHWLSLLQWSDPSSIRSSVSPSLLKAQTLTIWFSSPACVCPAHGVFPVLWLELCSIFYLVLY